MLRFSVRPRVFGRHHSSRPLYFTTPIFYVNAKPHLGHLYSMLMVDTRTRWEQFKPDTATYMLTGTDEHGIKVQTAAETAGVPPRLFVDQVSQNFRHLADAYSINHSRFMRTTDSDHVAAVTAFWNRMLAQGYLYKGAHKGWYSVTDEAFYTDAQITEHNGQKVAKETNSAVHYHEEENYFFRLSLFRDQLVRFLEQNPDFVQPPAKHAELLQAVRLEPLADLSVSRPSSRLQWGIPVPGDDTQTIYVWFDALVNYLTAAGYPALAQNSIWPAATHVVGKDIMRFHCVYWPIFLMAAGMELPKHVVVHTHWLNDGVKMSKSLGNVVDPIELVEQHGVDPVRFFLMEKANLDQDCKFSETALQENRDMLINKWANLISRCGGDKFDIAAGVQLHREGKFAHIDELIRKGCIGDASEIEAKRVELETELDKLYAEMDGAMGSFRQMWALQLWWRVVELANGWFQYTQPWLYRKQIAEQKQRGEDTRATELVLQYIVYLTAEAMRVATLCVVPFMPALAGKVLDLLRVDPARRNARYAVMGLDAEYGVGTNAIKDKKVLERRLA